MKFILYYFILILSITISLLFKACDTQTESLVDSDLLIIDHNTTQEISFEKFFDFSKIKVAQLVSKDNLTLSDRLEIIIEDGYIFVQDNRTGQLYRFNMDGKLINKIGRPGRGPAEYINATHFQVDKNDKIVDVLCDAGTKIQTYDYYGNYIKEFETPLTSLSFARINSNRYFFYSGFDGIDSPKRLHLSDTTGKINSYLKLETNIFDVTGEQNFASQGNYGLFRESFIPSIYRYDSKGIDEIIRFDFGEYEVTEDCLEKVDDPYKFFEDINRKGFCTSREAYKGNEIATLTTNCQEDRDGVMSHFYINLKDSSYTKVVSNEKEQYLQEFFNNLRIIHIDDNDYGYYYISSYYLNNLLKEKPELFSTNLEFNVDGNPLIIIFPLKE